MTMCHKALAAALLSGAVGFAIPSLAAATDNSSSTTATSTEKDSTAAANTGTPAKETKQTVRRRTAARAPIDEQHNIVEALNQKSLEAAQSGQAPNFAGLEPPTDQQAQTPRTSGKTTIRHRANTKASVKKGA